MYKVEIITTVGSFIAPATGVTDPLDALDSISTCIVEPGGAVILEDGSYLRLRNPGQIIGLRSYQDDVEAWKPIDPDEPLAPVTGTGKIEPYAESGVVEYLGVPIKIRLIGMMIPYANVSTVLYLLHKINGAPPEEFAKPANFRKIVASYLDKTYGPGNYPAFDLVTPHGIIDEEAEAMEYVKDYISETKPEYKPENMTGKAYGGWNEKGAGKE